MQQVLWVVQSRFQRSEKRFPTISGTISELQSRLCLCNIYSLMVESGIFIITDKYLIFNIYSLCTCNIYSMMVESGMVSLRTHLCALLTRALRASSLALSAHTYIYIELGDSLFLHNRFE